MNAASLLDLPALLAPLDASAPSGEDLEYDPAYLALLTAGAGKPEQQYGDTVIAAEPPDWRQVHSGALALAARTRDLRIAVWLVRSGARLHGIGGAVAGLQLLQGLVEQLWDSVHPQLDASDGNDPTMRLNAFAPLLHPTEGLADLRACSLGSARGSLRVRDLELAARSAEPGPGESVPTEAGVEEALLQTAQAEPALPALWQAGADAAQAIARAVDAHVGAGQSPDFVPLLRLMRLVSDAARRALATEAVAAVPADGAAPSAAVARSLDVVASRDDAVRALDRICDWLERHEPSHPAPLLLRRAQRLMSKSFLEIVRDLLPDGVDAVERLAGRPAD